MKSLVRIISLFAIISLPYGCISTNEIPYPGLIYSHQKYPGSFAAANDVKAEIKAKGCSRMILGLVSYGEAGAGNIAQDAGIKKIAWVDYEFFNIFYIYTTYCTIVYGE